MSSKLPAHLPQSRFGVSRLDLVLRPRPILQSRSSRTGSAGRICSTSNRDWRRIQPDPIRRSPSFHLNCVVQELGSGKVYFDDVVVIVFNLGQARGGKVKQSMTTNGHSVRRIAAPCLTARTRRIQNVLRLSHFTPTSAHTHRRGEWPASRYYGGRFRELICTAKCPYFLCLLEPCARQRLPFRPMRCKPQKQTAAAPCASVSGKPPPAHELKLFTRVVHHDDSPRKASFAADCFTTLLLICAAMRCLELACLGFSKASFHNALQCDTPEQGPVDVTCSSQQRHIGDM